MTEIKQPKIRFKGYINDWEQRKLGDMVDYVKGYAFKSNTYVDDGVRIVRVSDLSKSEIKKSGDMIYISKKDSELFDKYIINKSDIIVTTVGSKSEMKDSAVGRPIMVKSADEGLLNQNLVKLETKNKYNSYFIFNNLLMDRYSYYISLIERGNANQANITINDLWEYSLYTPNKEEQTKIGEFFKTLDDTITLHQQKLEVTKQFKQTMLKKMFPRNGQTKPEIRFKGFTDDWVECKLGDVCNILSGYNWKSTDYNVDGRFKVITIANVTGDYFINTDIGNNIDISNVDNKYVLKENDILITMTGNVGRVSKVPVGNYLLNQRVCKISSNSIYNEFLYTILSDIQFENYCILQGKGLAQANISNKDILNYKIFVPNIKEQIIISDFFKNIDLNILHLKNKIITLNNVKNTMLRKMFI